MTKKSDIKIISRNRKAYHEYTVLDSYEVGLVLTGSEIKSIRAGQVNLRDSYASVQNGEIWLNNAHIAPYHQANRENHEPRRTRKLLLHRREINRLTGRVQEKGLTLVPLKLYLKNNRAKIELGLAQGKKKYDKRASLKEREANRQIAKAIGQRQKHYD